jgi:regulator of protease activity HflC (stomatin/prohibitin superfamily)
VVYATNPALGVPDQFGVEQSRFGSKSGIVDKVYGPGLYFVGAGVTLHTFPRELHVLEATNERVEALEKARAMSAGEGQVERYFAKRDELLGQTTHRTIEPLNVQTSDGYSVSADVTLLYSIEDPVRIAKDFGWGTAYVDAFAINTFRNGVLATLGKMNAESFYDEAVRVAAVKEAEKFISDRFAERGFKVDKLLLRNYEYSANYEKSLHDKKVAVQMAEKNRKEGFVNDERAKLQQIDSKGNASITIAESEVSSQIAKIRAEADLYSSQVKAKANQEVGLASAEAKRLRADALNHAGGKYVVALETAKMFDGIEASVMTPEQYIAFIRNTWALVGLSPGGGAAGGGK